MIQESITLFIKENEMINFNGIYSTLITIRKKSSGCLSCQSSLKSNGALFLDSWWTDEDSLQSFTCSAEGKKWQELLNQFSTSPIATMITQVEAIGLDSCSG